MDVSSFAYAVGAPLATFVYAAVKVIATVFSFLSIQASQYSSLRITARTPQDVCVYFQERPYLLAPA